MDVVPPVWVLLLLGSLYALYKWSTKTFDTFKKLNIPFDTPVPLLGNMGPFIRKKISDGDSLKDVYFKYKGHGVIGFFQFLTPAFIVCVPELIKMITVKDFEHFTDHAKIIKEEDDPLYGKILLNLRGDRWKFMRHTLSPAFTSSKMKAMFQFVAECGEQMGGYLDTKCKDAGGRLTLNVKDFFARYANDVIATAAFGLKCDSLTEPDNEFYKMGKEVSNFDVYKTIKALGYLLIPSLMTLCKIQVVTPATNNFFLSLVTDTVAHREKERIVRPDMIHLLMEARKGLLKAQRNEDGVENDGNTKKSAYTELTDEDITAQATIFFLAGFHTASTNLSFLSHLLATHPEVMKRVQEEIDTMYQEGGGKITYDGIQNMKYTDMVISESLRLWPPILSVHDRICVKAYTIPATDSSPKIQLKVGDLVMFPVLGLHRDPEYFEDPDKFDPERFSDENKHKIKPFTYIPFGAGPRACIGIRFAVMETKVALACILSRFDLEVVSKTQKKLSLIKGSFMVDVEGGFWLGIKPR